MYISLIFGVNFIRVGSRFSVEYVLKPFQIELIKFSCRSKIHIFEFLSCNDKQLKCKKKKGVEFYFSRYGLKLCKLKYIKKIRTFQESTRNDC